ncbi:chemotaxis-specific protein-glutamate methyltransferase CheB [Legionella sp. D16C41]|uniref:chemotaxis-specific protein-glutamate methyltransferase CheB n=1 Tax=Legionella sp. D16C41 TaxID=3402688 RepID=UPI003AF9F1BB
MIKPIRVLIADDSKVSTQLLTSILEESTNIKVIGQAIDGVEAVRLTKQLKPDLITMDINMPNMDGIEATRIIMEECPTPIIIISSHSNNHIAENSFNALQAGALSIIEKPQSILDKNFKEAKQFIINSILTLAEVPVVTRRPNTSLKKIVSPPKLRQSFKILALGCSTGGPSALNCILKHLPANFNIPIVITQHITKGFLDGLINWLQHNTPLKIEIAKHNQFLEPGHVYFAPDNTHLTVGNSLKPIAILMDGTAIDHFKPSANMLFSSIAKSYPDSAIGGLLTGMGHDGAEGLLQMKKAGCYTFAQSEATSVIFGMPSTAIKMQAVDEILDLEQIATFLLKTCKGGAR